MIASAIIAGGGPSGLSAAIGLSRAGVRATVYEQRSRWQARVCGAFLNPEAVRHLEWLGVLPQIQKEAVVVEKTTVTFKSQSRDISIRQGRTVGLGVPRQRLEEVLKEKARECGVDLITGKRYELSDSFVILADGRFSNHPSKQNKGWYGWNATFTGVRQQPGEMTLHFYNGGYVGVLTFADGYTNICGLVHRSDNQPLHWDQVYEQALRKSNSFSFQMKSAKRLDDWHGVGPLPFSTRLRSMEKNSIRVGDAAAVGDPFMGEGNGRALGAGPMIFQALKESKENNLQDVYSRLWRNAYSTRFKIGWAVRFVLERPGLFSIIAPFFLKDSRLIERATPHFHSGFLVKAKAL